MNRSGGLILFSSLIFFSCNYSKPGKISNLHNGKIIACGHGGSGFQSLINPYPTNSLISIQNALNELKADGVELDVQLSADKIFYLYHDERLESSSSCKGCIPDRASGEIDSCNYKRFPGKDVLNQRKIIRLEEVFSYFSGKDKLFYLDMRLNNACKPENIQSSDTIADNLARLVRKYKQEKNVSVIAQDISFLSSVKKSSPEIHTIVESDSPSLSIKVAQENKFSGIICYNHMITKDDVAKAHAANLEVIIFDVKIKKGTKAAIKKHPDVIQSDYLSLLIKMLN